MRRISSSDNSAYFYTPPTSPDGHRQRLAHSEITMRPVPSPSIVAVNHLPVNAFVILCSLYYLLPKEVGRLSRISRPVQQALFIPEATGFSLLEKNRDIARCSAYKVHSQTLDLAESFLNIDILHGRRYPQLIEEVLYLLNKYPAWAKSQIKTLVFPSKTLAQVSERALKKLVSLLPGVHHLCLSLQVENPLVPGYNGIGMYEELKVFKQLPLKKITFENSAYIFPSLLHNALNQGAFSVHTECFAFVIKKGPPYPHPFNCTFSFDETHYPKLHTLDFSQGLSFYLTPLPPTINCLHISSHSQIFGSASTISRLEITYLPYPTAPMPLPYIAQLPGLQEIYTLPSTNPLYHKIALERLLTLTFPPPLSIQFASLHIYNPLLLVKLCEKFAGNIHIKNQVTLHIHAGEETDNFIILARDRLFDHLPSLQYQLDSFDSSTLFFYQTLANLWRESRLTSLNHLAIIYDESLAADARQGGNIGEAGSAQFIDSALGKEIYANIKQPYQHTLSLAQFLKHDDLTPLLTAFNAIRLQINATVYNSLIDNDKIKNTFLGVLQKAFQRQLAKYQAVLHEAHPWESWASLLERVHTELYEIYVQHLQKLPGLFVPDTLFLLPALFYQTELGKIIALRTQHYFFTGVASRIMGETAAFMSEHNFQRSYTILPTGFNIHFFKTAAKSNQN